MVQLKIIAYGGNGLLLDETPILLQEGEDEPQEVVVQQGLAELTVRRDGLDELCFHDGDRRHHIKTLESSEGLTAAIIVRSLEGTYNGRVGGEIEPEKKSRKKKS